MDVTPEIHIDIRNGNRETLLEYVDSQVNRLDRFHPHITACRVSIEEPHAHATDTSPYRVRVLCTVPPSHELVVDRRPAESGRGEPLQTIVKGVFHSMERQLKELAKRQHR